MAGLKLKFKSPDLQHPYPQTQETFSYFKMFFMERKYFILPSISFPHYKTYLYRLSILSSFIKPFFYTVYGQLAG